MKEKTYIKLIEGYHITATEKRSIRQMLDAGYKTVRNRPNTKSYEIIEEFDDDRYKIKIGTKATWTIGDVPKWQYSTVIVKDTKKVIWI